MDRNGFLAVVLVLFIVSDSSSASLAWNFRKFIGVAPKDNSTVTKISPLPSPVSGGKESSTSSIDADGSGKEKPKDPEVASNSSKVDPKGSNDNNNTGFVSPPTDKQVDKGKHHEGKEKEKGNNTTVSQLGTNGSCEGSSKSCRDQKSMLACIQTFENVSKQLVLLVQNEGESTLKVNLTIPPSEDNVLPAFEIPKHKSKKVNFSLTLGKKTRIALNAGNGDCLLHMDPPDSEGNLFQLLSFYSKQVTPIYGAYFLFLVVLVFGGTCACCKLRKRRRQDGVPYQELEMGLPESAVAVNVDTAEGWDQDWDDDWDEDKAVKSPGGRHVGNISANGLTSRSFKRDGWENDWVD